jgi:IrrE N-terminal-like domain
VALSSAQRSALRLAERVAADVRTSVTLGPTASGVAIAEDLGFGWEFDSTLPDWFHGACSRQRPLIVIAPGPTEQSTGFRCMHEVGHFHLEDQLRGEMLELACQRFAGAMLMPPFEFRKKVDELGRNPYDLQGFFEHCSLEAIASRLADLYPAIAVASWNWWGRKWLRMGEGVVLFKEDFAVMDAALGAVYASKARTAWRRAGGLNVLAVRTQDWPKRAITIAEVNH